LATSHQIRDYCLAPARVADAPLAGDRYGRLFPGLEPLIVDDALLHALGRSGGPCDASVLPTDRDGREAAGWPLFGQFVAHDLTADRSPVTHHADTATLRNSRSPRINLETVYGGGPVGSPYLFQRADTAKLLLRCNDAGEYEDLPRNAEGIALIGDPRNDTHLFVSQLHVAMLKLHNLLVDRLREDGVGEDQLFDEARRSATWHYQWIVLRDFLPRLIGDSLTDELLRDGPRYFLAGGDREPFIPFEFADAGYRYGHSQIRRSYRIADGREPVPVFPDLQGFRPVPAENVIDWPLLFDCPGHPPAQRAKTIDGALPKSLIDLPLAITGEVADADLRSLALRDLERGSGVGLPSGEAIAEELGVPPLTPDELGLSQDWDGGTPLWLYVLKEAQARSGGDQLGPVGACIVGEVLVGLIDHDPESWRTNEADWEPTLSGEHQHLFGLGDLLSHTSPVAVRLGT
jgi:hypothetical protein